MENYEIRIDIQGNHKPLNDKAFFFGYQVHHQSLSAHWKKNHRVKDEIVEIRRFGNSHKLLTNNTVNNILPNW